MSAERPLARRPRIAAARLFAACAFLAAGSAGCRFQQPPSNPKIAPVHGRITVNGKPEAGLQVYFHSSSTRPSGALTDEDGRYVLRFDPQQMGAAIGSHVVRITRNLEPYLDPKPELPPQYNEQSKFVIRVEPGDNEFNFDLIEEEQNAGDVE